MLGFVDCEASRLISSNFFSRYQMCIGDSNASLPRDFLLGNLRIFNASSRAPLRQHVHEDQYHDQIGSGDVTGFAWYSAR